jgi:hypothetical protein
MSSKSTRVKYQIWPVIFHQRKIKRQVRLLKRLQLVAFCRTCGNMVRIMATQELVHSREVLGVVVAFAAYNVMASAASVR